MKDQDADLKKVFGTDWDDMDEQEKGNARTLYGKVKGSKGTFTEDDVFYHSTNPSGRLKKKPEAKPSVSDYLFTPPPNRPGGGEPDGLDPIMEKQIKGKK